MTLRSKIIRLAYAQPSLRPHLLPLLKTGEDHQAALPRSIYLPRDNPTLIQRKNTPPGLEIWTYEKDRGDGKGLGYYATAFWGRAQKPLWSFRFRDVMDQERKIQETIDIYKKDLERKVQQRAERSQFQHGLQVGDIMVGSWGYDQTNVDFYEIVGTPTPKMVVLREVGKKVVREERGADYVAAVPGHYKGPEIKKIPGPGGVRINDVVTVRKWDGKPQYQTPWGMGH